jgi:DNA-binding NarL/FixJ family response regulator
MTRIMIVDDHQMFIDGLTALLADQEELQIMGEANSGREALAILEKEEPDLMITDLSMPEMPGLELVKTVKERYPCVKILVLSMHNDRETVGAIMMSEAEGYILKNTGKSELMTAIERITGGSTYYSNEILSLMLEKLKKEKKREEAIKELTDRELEVLKLIIQEYSSEEMAAKLYVSRRTIDSHRKNIMHKTRVKTIVGLIKYAYRNDLVNS